MTGPENRPRDVPRRPGDEDVWQFPPPPQGGWKPSRSARTPATEQQKKKFRRSAAVTLGITGLLAAGLTGYALGNDDDDAEDADYAAVCVDSQTEQRVEDGSCDEGGGQRFYGGGGGFYGWYFLPVGGRAPAIGQRAAGGSLASPPGRSVRGGIDRAGGTVSRGGFGVSGRSGGSGG